MSLSHQRECPLNCLFCDIENNQNCLVCDFTKNYNRDPSGACVLTDLNQCFIYSPNGEECRMCEEDLIFEATECVESTDTNCVLLLEGQCRECPERKKKDPILETCIDPTDLSDLNCEVYNGEDCQKCKRGYRLNNDGSCSQVTGVAEADLDACLMYTDYICQDCGENAFFYENSLTAHLFADN